VLIFEKKKQKKNLRISIRMRTRGLQYSSPQYKQFDHGASRTNTIETVFCIAEVCVLAKLNLKLKILNRSKCVMTNKFEKLNKRK
jgi:hypothetical protein